MSDGREASRVGILISGRGSNMVSLVRAMHAGTVAAQPAVVISNLPGAPGLSLAADLGVKTEVVRKRKRTREEHEHELIDTLRRHDVDWVCLAGYMRLLSSAMVEEFRERILNIHPSLLPAFPGLDAQRQALEYGARFTGCTVHLVDEQCDHGPILLQAAVPIHQGDTEASLSARILEQEHRIYPEALDLCARGRVTVEGRRTRIRPAD